MLPTYVCLRLVLFAIPNSAGTANPGTHCLAFENPPGEFASGECQDCRGEKILRKNEFVRHPHKQRPKLYLRTARVESAIEGPHVIVWTKNVADKRASAHPRRHRSVRRSSSIPGVPAAAWATVSSVTCRAWPVPPNPEGASIFGHPFAAAVLRRKPG